MAAKSTEKPSDVGLGSWICLVISALLAALSLQLILENPELAQSFLSTATWKTLVSGVFGGTITNENLPTGEVQTFAVVPYWGCALLVLGLQGVFLAVLQTVQRGRPPEARGNGPLRLARWWGWLAGWGVLWLAALIGQFLSVAEVLQGTVVFWVAITVAGSLFEMSRGFIDGLSTESAEVDRSPDSPRTRLIARPEVWLIGGMLIYVVTFTTMNWGLWFNLRLPHGDSAMYEEHLWNFWHGKGFRSYLDQGLFLGEHIQVVHLLLLPLYVMWPSHLLLELCESIALAAGAIPVYWLALRASGSRRAAALLGLTYLVYFPLQFLDIAVDLKTFRPIAFGVAPVLFALDQIERRHFGWAIAFLALALACKEDYAIVVFSIGLVMIAMFAWNRWRGATSPTADLGPRALGWGVGYLLFGPVYLLLALRAIRWFRDGVEVHYAGYFTRFGNSTGEIIWNMLTDPGLLLVELLTTSTLIYGLAILVPLGFLPLRAPLRLLGCAPMFVLLCLNELASDPRHHFHAPLIPLLFWAAAGGLQNRWADILFVFKKSPAVASNPQPEVHSSAWALCCGFSCAMWFSLSPLGVAFWDPGSAWYYRELYLPDERARQFAAIADLIPKSARVASTDYVHPRFTHHERSYDYSNYARRVSGNSTSVPADTDYIVIDTRHPYSEIRDVSQVRELQTEPDRWEVLPDRTHGYFIVLKRREE